MVRENILLLPKHENVAFVGLVSEKSKRAMPMIFFIFRICSVVYNKTCTADIHTAVRVRICTKIRQSPAILF